MAVNRWDYAKRLTKKMGIWTMILMLALPQLSMASGQSRNWTLYGKPGMASNHFVGSFDNPSGVAVDGAGNVYVADTFNHRIQKRDAATGTWSVINTKTDGPGTGLGEFNSPRAVAVDTAGNVYVADTDNNRIQVFAASAGMQAEWKIIGDPAQFKHPKGLAVDHNGNVYVADTDNNRIRKLDVVSQEWIDYTGFKFPRGVAVDGEGNVYVADSANYSIRKLNASGPAAGTWETISAVYGNGPGQLKYPSSLATDQDGNLYVADTFNHRVQKRDADTGAWSDWKKNGGGSGKLPGEFDLPFGVAVDGNGNVYVADTNNHRIQMHNADTGTWSGWGYQATIAGQGLGEFNSPTGVALDNQGNVYVTDYENHRVQMLDSTGIWREWGRDGGQSGSVAGEFTNPTGIAVTVSGSVYVADRDNHRIQILGVDGVWNAIGQRGSQLGEFEFPNDVAVDREGNVYVADLNNGRIQKRIAGTGQWVEIGYGRGTTPGKFEYPSGVAVDDAGNVYVADTDNHRIQKLDVFLDQWEVIGFGEGNGLGQFNEPYDVTIDSKGNIYVADMSNHRVQMLDISTGSWREWGKTGAQSGSTPGEFSSPTGVAVNGKGDIFVADFGNHRIQKWVFSKPDAPTGVTATTGNGEATVSFTAPAYDGGSAITGYTITSSPGGLTASGSSSPIKITGLTNGTDYVFTVVATNAEGDSIASAASNAVTPMTVPDAPTNVQAKVGNGEATVSFTAPAYNGGSAITGYTVTSIPGGLTATGTASPIKITGLTNGTSYTFTVTAANAAGGSVSSASSSAVTPSVPPAGGGGGSSSLDTITIDVQDGSGDKSGIVSRATLRRTTDAGGRKKDELTLTAEQASQAIEQLKKAGSNTARIVVPDAKDEVSELIVKLPKATAVALSDSKIDLELVTNGVRILVPYASFQGVSQDVYFRLVPIKAAAERKEIEKRAATEPIVSDKLDKTTLIVQGRPMEIETNLSSRPVTLILPLEQKTTAEQAANLYIFIQHSDGTKELIQGELVSYDATGKQGIRFTVQQFSTFTVLEGRRAKQAAANKAYMIGFKDGTFRPDKEMTRAEMAMILYNLSGVGASTHDLAYPDVSGKHWAGTAIGYASASGLMKGAPDGRFNPDRPITRAEMAIIVLRLKAAAATEAATAAFSDTAGHWAEASIRQAQAAGYMNGYKDGAFRPEQTLTRSEAVTIVNRVLNREPLTTNDGKWSDVPAGYWAFGAIQAATIDHTAGKPKN
ncbi:S-layer homology domain-containing protein [Cohnella herbarum]|uniref:Uncharacterized protein n=1 Tax=Cohnella herbarum TaxID=2728023 RepID=A0A7Z2VPP2_9BACL|nr:S-layer homology domain-containing protein [Cohnella herbarum]QJD86852.1 hypothetical protein HH215_29220 [Cohnella herbarum]